MATAQQRARVLQYAPAAQRVQATTGIPASVILGQMVLESGWLEHLPVGSNNPFGIKAKAGEPYVISTTTEYVNGKPTTRQEKFKKYNSIDEALADHARLLQTGRYNTLLGKDYITAANILQNNGYAGGNTGYAAQLRNVIESNSLTAYDTASNPADAIKKMVSDLGLTITSATRTPEHNAEVGGAKGSAHLTGQALDVAGGTKEQLDKLAAEARAAGYNVLWQTTGHYDHVHIDWRNKTPAAPISDTAASTSGESSIASSILRAIILVLLFVFGLIFLFGAANSSGVNVPATPLQLVTKTIGRRTKKA